MNDRNKIFETILFLIGGVIISWFALLTAPNIDDGLIGIINNLSNNLNNPFKIEFCENSVKTVLIFLLIYIFSIGVYMASKRNYRRGKEYGSAIWGNAIEINKKYMQFPKSQNKILTKNVMLGLNARKHRRNLNVLVVGGSGAGKTRFYAKPNIMQCNSSHVVLDPKGEILRDTGYLLEKEGYKIKVLDLVNTEKSHSYNPFAYIKNDNDIQKLVGNLFKSTTPKGSQSQDPFWDISASMLLSALFYYLKYEAPEEEQNFSMASEMMRAGKPKEDEEDYESPLDILFKRLEHKNPNHIAVKYYKDYHSGAGKTLKSIIVTLASKLEKFNLDAIEGITKTDELELDKLGTEKIALFAIIPDNNTDFNFLVSILYTQIFQVLYYKADYEYGGALPIPVHFVMDEFANVALPNDFEKILSTMRSRNISVSIILQNLSQLKALFEKNWESIIGNCDEFLYLGGNEQSSYKYVSELLGKETIDTNTYGRSTGHSGNYSTNYQQTGRELLTQDEVRMLDNDSAILLIRGEKPIFDKKYDILKHPNVKYTTDGQAKPYKHGKTDRASVSIIKLEDDEIDISKVKDLKNYKIEENFNLELLSEEDIEDYYLMEDYENERNKEN